MPDMAESSLKVFVVSEGTESFSVFLVFFLESFKEVEIDGLSAVRIKNE